MKKCILSVVALIVMFFSASGIAVAKDGTKVPGKVATINNANFSISYGQPSKDDRVIFGDRQAKAVVPYKQIWRAGSPDHPVEITINKDCLFAGHQLKAGKYTLFITPAPGEWMITLNSKLGQTAATTHEQVKDKDVLLAALSAKHLDTPVETFTITAQEDGFTIAWDQASGYISVKPLNK